MISRVSKQFIVGGVYVLLAVLIVGGNYWYKNRPTCDDGIRNGKEESVDCGTVACGRACVSPIQAMVVQDIQWIKTPANDFDVAALIYNPNVDYGANLADYDLVILDSSGEEISRQPYSFYMLPGQTKYIVLTSLKNIPDGSSAGIQIKSVNWQKVISVQDINFIIAREAVTTESGQTNFQAVITNSSNFDFDTIDVSVVVVNSSGAVIATNKTNFQTFLSGTERAIKVTWPFVLSDDLRVRVDVSTNVFNNSNFLKRNGTQEKFQQYY